jgi:hypothetical protein
MYPRLDCSDVQSTVRLNCLGNGRLTARSSTRNKGAISLFDAVKTDLTLVTDLPNFRITGPIFAGNDDAAYGGKTAELDADIAAHMRDGNRPAVLVTMGSSGTSELLFGAIKALMPTLDAREKVPQDDWNVLILASPAICRLDEAQAVARNHPRLLVTDRFIPGPVANAMADLVVTHGGQGTVQTAIAAGIPIVGVGSKWSSRLIWIMSWMLALGSASSGTIGEPSSPGKQSHRFCSTRDTRTEQQYLQRQYGR